MLGIDIKRGGRKNIQRCKSIKKKKKKEKKKKERDMNGWTKRRESETKSSIP